MSNPTKKNFPASTGGEPRRRSVWKRAKRRLRPLLIPVWLLSAAGGYWYGQETGDWRIFVIGTFGIPYADIILTF